MGSLGGQRGHRTPATARRGPQESRAGVSGEAGSAQETSHRVSVAPEGSGTVDLASRAPRSWSLERLPCPRVCPLTRG